MKHQNFTGSRDEPSSVWVLKMQTRQRDRASKKQAGAQQRETESWDEPSISLEPQDNARFVKVPPRDVGDPKTPELEWPSGFSLIFFHVLSFSFIFFHFLSFSFIFFHVLSYFSFFFIFFLLL